jgi:hypothetical protein
MLKGKFTLNYMMYHDAVEQAQKSECSYSCEQYNKKSAELQQQK